MAILLVLVEPVCSLYIYLPTDRRPRMQKSNYRPFSTWNLEATELLERINGRFRGWTASSEYPTLGKYI